MEDQNIDRDHSDDPEDVPTAPAAVDVMDEVAQREIELEREGDRTSDHVDTMEESDNLNHINSPDIDTDTDTESTASEESAFANMKGTTTSTTDEGTASISYPSGEAGASKLYPQVTTPDKPIASASTTSSKQKMSLKEYDGSLEKKSFSVSRKEHDHEDESAKAKARTTYCDPSDAAEASVAERRLLRNSSASDKDAKSGAGMGTAPPPPSLHRSSTAGASSGAHSLPMTTLNRGGTGSSFSVAPCPPMTQLQRSQTEASTSTLNSLMSMPGALAMPGWRVSELNSYAGHPQRPSRATSVRTDTGPAATGDANSSSLMNDDDDMVVSNTYVPRHRDAFQSMTTMSPMIPVLEAELVSSATELESVNTRRSVDGLDEEQARAHPSRNGSGGDEEAPRPRRPSSSSGSDATISSNSYEEDDAGDGEQQRHGRRSQTASSRRLSRSVSRWPQYEYRDNPNGSSVSSTMSQRHQARVRTQTQAQVPSPSGDAVCCAIDVQVEPDPVSCLCWRFQGSHTWLTRRVPLVHAISLMLTWITISVVTIALLSTRSNRQINNYLAEHLEGDGMQHSGSAHPNGTLFGDGSAASSRLNAIANVLAPAVTSPLVFAQEDTVQVKALRWLAYEDPQELNYMTEQGASALVQRFSAKVMLLSLMEDLHDLKGMTVNEEEHECDWALVPVADFVSPLSGNASNSIAGIVIANAQVSPSPDSEPDYNSFYYDDYDTDGDEGENRFDLTGIDAEEDDDWEDESTNRGGSMGPPGSSEGGGWKRSQCHLEFQCNAQKQVTKIHISGVFVAHSLPYEFSNFQALESLSIVKATYATSSHALYQAPSLISPLKQLNHLTHLALGVDDFSSIEGISDLRHLNDLELFSGNKGDGENSVIPSELSLLWNLKRLAFHNVGVMPSQPLIPDRVLFNLHSLESLSVDGCRPVRRKSQKRQKGPRIPGSFELGKYVSSLTNMQNISITNCIREVKGSLTSNIGQLSKLRHLALPGVIVENSTIPDTLWSQLANITHLDLHKNKLHGSIPPTGLASMTQLEFLNLSGNGFTGRIPKEMTNLQHLRMIDLSSNRLTGTIPDLNLKQLSTLALNRNYLTGQVFSGLCDATQLTSVSMGQNMFEGFAEHCAERLTNLEHISANRVNISQSVLQSLCYMSQLKTLEMSRTSLTGGVASCLGELRHLQVLHMEHNQLSGTIPAEVGSLPNLSLFDFHNNDLSGSLPLTLCRATNMTVLSLGKNQLSSSLPSCIGELEQLRFLLLDDNKFEGPLSSEIGQLSKLRRLDLSINSFSSTLPSDVGKMSRLHAMIVSHNRFSGPIPNAIGNLTSLELLDFSDNRLEGSIPSSFVDLDALEKMSLVGNEGLTGDLASFCSKRRDEYRTDDSESFSESKDIRRDPGRGLSFFSRRRALQEENPEGGLKPPGTGPGIPGGGPPGGKPGPGDAPPGGKPGPGGRPSDEYFADKQISCSCCATQKQQPDRSDGLHGGAQTPGPENLPEELLPNNPDPTISNMTHNKTINTTPIPSSIKPVIGRARNRWYTWSSSSSSSSSSSDWN